MKKCDNVLSNEPRSRKITKKNLKTKLQSKKELAKIQEPKKIYIPKMIHPWKRNFYTFHSLLYNIFIQST